MNQVTSGQLFLKAILVNKTSFPTEQTPHFPKFHQDFRRDHGKTEDSLKLHPDLQKTKETSVFRLQKKITNLTCENTNIIINYMNNYNNCIALIFLKNENMTEDLTNVDNFHEQLMYESIKCLFLENSLLINIFSYNFTQGNDKKLMKNICRRLKAPLWLCSNFCDKTAHFRHTFRSSINSYLELQYLPLCKFLKTYKKGQQYMCICDSQDTCAMKLRESVTGKIDTYKKFYIQEKLTNNTYKILRTHLHIQRKLLSAIDKAPENNRTEVNVLANMSGTQGDLGQNRGRFGHEEEFNYTKFMQVVEYLNRRRSKDPLWAICSIMALIAVLVWAMWCCGLRKINTKKYINVNIDEHFHYVSVRDILRSKKRYLSKKILQFKRRHRHKKRKYRRLKDPEKIEHDIVSDNSEEERLIYSVNDF